MNNRILVFLSAALALSALHPESVRGETVEEYLRAFHANPALMMERLPSVVDESGEATPQGFLEESDLDIQFRQLKELRALLGTTPSDLGTAAPDKDHDSAEKLLEPGTQLERNLPAMQAQSLMNIVAPIKPWADSYWPTYRGQTAYRYADRAFPNSKSWDVNHSYSLSNPASGIVSGGSELINFLSPSEKYDFVMGDPDWTLTHFAWYQGQKLVEDEGSVPTWQGICHGWSAAAHMGAPFVAKPVTVIAQNGTPVTFYPQDIKALQSMLWANGAPTSRFVGTRCNVAHPQRNGNGRILDPACFDVNPATWHLDVVNQLGRNHRGFVFNGTLGEVWNFPLVSARYRYFNPQTLEETPSLSNAEIPMESFRVDKFREFRSPDARKVVGIYMDLTYVVEIEPGISRVFDAPTKTVRYIYDLELDAYNNVVGGEWYSNVHPNFIWTFDSSAQAMAFDENVLLTDPWVNNGPVPLAWTPYARKASARGIPVYAFIKKVVDSAGPVHQP